MLLFLFGPSGVDKTEIIRFLVRTEGLRYISPDTTRQLRSEETDKCYVSDATFDAHLSRGMYKWVNQLFKARYGTPRHIVEEALRQPQLSHILHFPLSRLDDAMDCPGHKEFAVLMPPSQDVLSARLSDAGRGERTKES